MYKTTDLVTIGKNQYKIISIDNYRLINLTDEEYLDFDIRSGNINMICTIQNIETLEIFKIPLSLIENINK